eukprot:SAG31_NODE_12078_length_970_cov_1.824340_2_plen_134_part_01
MDTQEDARGSARLYSPVSALFLLLVFVTHCTHVGMGGIGKTTVSSWLARQDDVRKQFDVMAWVSLGQNPNIDKCQELLHLQLTSKEMNGEIGQEERQEKLRQAMTGRKVVLFLDDLWEGDTHEQMLNFVDDSTA